MLHGVVILCLGMEMGLGKGMHEEGLGGNTLVFLFFSLDWVCTVTAWSLAVFSTVLGRGGDISGFGVWPDPLGSGGGTYGEGVGKWNGSSCG